MSFTVRYTVENFRDTAEIFARRARDHREMARVQKTQKARQRYLAQAHAMDEAAEIIESVEVRTTCVCADCGKEH